MGDLNTGRGDYTYNPYGANKFDRLDKTNASDSFVRYLKQYGETSFAADYIRKSVEQLRLCEGGAHLGVGCGTAHDVGILAQAVGPTGLLVLFDRSNAMARASMESIESADIGGCRHYFVKGDAQNIPLANNLFDSTRIVRVLQHLDDPGQTLCEMARSLCSGGRLCAIEPIWSKTDIASEHNDVYAAFLDDVHQRIVKHPAIGANLQDLCRQAGLEVVNYEVLVHRFEDLSSAAEVITFDDRLQALVNRGAIARGQADAWLGELQQRSRNGTFAASLPFGFVVARKP